MRLFRVFFGCCGPRQQRSEETKSDTEENPSEKKLKEPCDDIISEFRSTADEQSPLHDKIHIDSNKQSSSEKEITDLTLTKSQPGDDDIKPNNSLPEDYYKILFEDRLLRNEEKGLIKYVNLINLRLRRI